MTQQLIDFLVLYYNEIQALAGLIGFSAVSYFSYNIVNNLEEKEEYALARFFLKRKTSRSFWVISVSALILSFGMALKNIGVLTDNKTYIAIALLSTLLMLLGLIYFTYNIELITRPGLDHASGEKNEEKESDREPEMSSEREESE